MKKKELKELEAKRNFVEEFENLQKSDMDYEIYISKMRYLSNEIKNYLDWNFSYDEYQTREYCELYDIYLEAHQIGKALI